MKTATAPLIALMNTGTFAMWDLYTITLAGGGQLLFTAGDFDVAFGGVKWSSKGVHVDTDNTKALAHWKIGLDVDTWQVAVMPRSRSDVTGIAFPDKIGSVPWLAAAAQGTLDAADVLIQRAYFPTAPTYPIPAAGAVPTGVLTIFRGQIAEVDCNTSMALLTINDYRQLLTVNMPRNFYQSACRHRLFDAQCTLNQATYVKTGVVGSNSTRSSIVAAVAKPTGSGTYTLGRMVMTTGLNAGFQRTVSLWDGAQTFTLLNPFPFTIAQGDAFKVYPGCDKQTGTCSAFGNLINFGGNPFVPIPEAITSP